MELGSQRLLCVVLTTSPRGVREQVQQVLVRRMPAGGRRHAPGDGRVVVGWFMDEECRVECSDLLDDMGQGVGRPNERARLGEEEDGPGVGV